MVALQILLKKEWRNPEGVQSARAALQGAGMNPVSSGAASFIADVSSEVFASMFGPAASAAITEQRPAGDLSLSLLPVPPQLAEFVESISLAPKHLYLEHPPEDRRSG